MVKQSVLNDFYVTPDSVTKQAKIDINHYGDYRMGLTGKEVKHYLKARCLLPQYKDKFKYSDNLYKKFIRIAGVNTTGIAPNGESLLYRHDTERFADVLFDGGKTYFD